MYYEIPDHIKNQLSSNCVNIFENMQERIPKWLLNQNPVFLVQAGGYGENDLEIFWKRKNWSYCLLIWDSDNLDDWDADLEDSQRNWINPKKMINSLSSRCWDEDTNLDSFHREISSLRKKEFLKWKRKADIFKQIQSLLSSDTDYETISSFILDLSKSLMGPEGYQELQVALDEAIEFGLE